MTKDRQPTIIGHANNNRKQTIIMFKQTIRGSHWWEDDANNMRARSGSTPLDTGCNAHPKDPKLDLKLPDQMGTARRAGGNMVKGFYDRV